MYLGSRRGHIILQESVMMGANRDIYIYKGGLILQIMKSLSQKPL